MKKMICIIAILLVVVVGGVFESVVSSRFYRDIEKELINVNELLQNENDENFFEASLLIEKTVDKWQKREKILLATAHHNIVHSFDEKLVMLKTVIECREYSDARMTCAGAIEMANYLAKESKPTISNML